LLIDVDYTLLLEFENGKKCVFDMRPYLDKKPFVRIKDAPLVRAGKGGLWNDGLTQQHYDRSVPV